MSRFSLKNISPFQIFAVFLIILVLIFIAQNFQNVTISLILWNFEIPLFILLAITFVIGFLTAVAFGSNKVPPPYEVEIHTDK